MVIADYLVGSDRFFFCFLPRHSIDISWCVRPDLCFLKCDTEKPDMPVKKKKKARRDLGVWGLAPSFFSSDTGSAATRKKNHHGRRRLDETTCILTIYIHIRGVNNGRHDSVPFSLRLGTWYALDGKGLRDYTHAVKTWGEPRLSVTHR